MKPEHMPALDREAFHCPRCGVYARQVWRDLYVHDEGRQVWVSGYKSARCEACDHRSMWWADTLIQPLTLQGEPPHTDMPEDVAAIYEEARTVAPFSRKSAAGLLRLGLQVLVNELEPGSGTIDHKIGRLVSRGLDPQVQQAMDVLRVMGNEAVHPGQIDLDADDELLPALFNLANIIVEQVVARPKHINALFEKLPAAKLEGIERRDRPALEAKQSAEAE